MAYTESNMIPLGSPAPEFQLLNPATGKTVGLQEVASGAKATVVMFLCNHCPYVLYINPEIVRIVAEYKTRGVAFVGINSNDAEAHPEDGPDQMPTHAEEVGYDFPTFMMKRRKWPALTMRLAPLIFMFLIRV